MVNGQGQGAYSFYQPKSPFHTSICNPISKPPALHRDKSYQNCYLHAQNRVTNKHIMRPTTSIHQTHNKLPNTPFTSTPINSIIHGPRPSLLKIKTPSSLSTQRQQKQKHQSKDMNDPVIIYVASPKIIHARPQDFMALVQSLTGRSPNTRLERIDDHSVSRSEGSFASGNDSRNADSSKVLSSLIKSPNVDLNEPAKFACMSDIPLYTPTGLDLFYS